MAAASIYGRPTTLASLSPQQTGFNGLTPGQLGQGAPGSNKATKTVYTESGDPVTVGADYATTVWKPNTGYSPNNFFSAPPPSATAVQVKAGVLPEATVAAQRAASSGGSTSTARSASSGGGSGAPIQDMRAELALRDEYNRAAEGRQQQALQAALAAVKSNAAPVAAPDDLSDTAADDAIYGANKERLGLQGRAAVNTAQDVMGLRGFGSAPGAASPVEAEMLGGVVGTTNMNLGEAARDQLTQTLARRRSVRDRNYAGQLQQRGQDLAATTAITGQFARPANLY